MLKITIILLSAGISTYSLRDAQEAKGQDYIPLRPTPCSPASLIRPAAFQPEYIAAGSATVRPMKITI